MATMQQPHPSTKVLGVWQNKRAFPSLLTRLRPVLVKLARCGDMNTGIFKSEMAEHPIS